jgi:hypothetical protein
VSTTSRGPYLASLVSFILGLAVGTVGAFVQAARTPLFGVSIPWGVIFMLGVVVLAIRLAVNATRTRWAGSALFVGWLFVTIGFATKTPWSGDLIITTGGRQLTYLLVGVVLGSAAATVRPATQSMLAARMSAHDGS